MPSSVILRSSTVAAIVVLAALCAGVLATVRSSGDAAREIRLVARDMAFFDADNGAASPTLRLRRGERVRIVLTNDDPGYAHNVVSPVLALEMPLVTSGNTKAVEVVVPDVPGVSTYSCAPHGQMMRGNIAIE